MSDPVRAAIIMGAALCVAVWISHYYSPYHACVRGLEAKKLRAPEVRCARVMGGRR